MRRIKVSEQPQKREIKIEFPPALRGGVYCNNMIVTHTKEEFIMDFMMIVPPMGTVTARVIMSPGHMKRTAIALQQNLKKYEERFGIVKEAEEPTKGKLGFHTP
jgi:hypothetical protein